MLCRTKFSEVFIEIFKIVFRCSLFLLKVHRMVHSTEFIYFLSAALKLVYYVCRLIINFVASKIAA